MPTASQAIDYTKLRQDLARAVARLCPRWLSSQRDDLVQAAVMRIMQIVTKQATTEGSEPLFASSYLYRVAHSALVDEMRRMMRRQETPLDDAMVERTAVTFQDPERAAASRQIGRGIQDCLARMQRDRRSTVVLYLMGHSVPDISRVLDWPVKRTENLVYRGLADLRECLQRKGMQP